ncbi:S41 family peptidase [Psychroserpens damuponensis]|uniref:S41 family peptidase n=1 Tax=Psychroserpens damuponensis TaxID=943936 RepID=UPI00058ADEB1|nr:S41 family peptidase [Psychroserpens damuponensis]
MKTIVLSIICLYCSFSALGQENEFATDFNYLKKQLESNYAGFNDKVSKNQLEYNKLVSHIDTLVKTSTDTLLLESKLKEYVAFFKDDHLQYYVVAEEMKKQAESDNEETTSQTMSLELLPDATIITIPSFERVYKKRLDSLLKSNHNEITSRSTLLIDIRNNGGGIDATFRGLLPYLYTKPFKSYSVEIRVSDDNLKYYENLVNDKSISENDKQTYKSLITKMKNTEKDFVNMNDSIVYQESFDKVFALPNKVGILFNSKTASSAEEFLLRARQSSKVTFFGKATSGTLDYSNPRIVWMPSEKRVMAMPISRSTRLPENGIDDTGILPDSLVNDNKESIKELIKKMIR